MERDVPAEETWVCEGCAHVYESADPPDECAWCAHRYFESYADLQREKRVLGVH